MKNEMKIINDKKVLLIKEVHYKSRREIKWNIIEHSLKSLVGDAYTIKETNDVINIASDFPDEYCHSNYTIKLHGAYKRAKAYISPYIPELLQIATNKSHSIDYDKKHGKKANNGWLRYITYFGIPIYDNEKTIISFNLYSATLVVRCTNKNKYYLYDIINIKRSERTALDISIKR